MITIKDVTDYLETVAPKDYQEPYDNAGLLTGDPSWPVRGIITTLDCTEAVVDEAINSGCNLVVAHHPVIFKGLKKLTGSHYVERVIIKAIRHEVAIYAIHTNLDHVYHGVNHRICEKIGLHDLKILSPRKDTLSKLVTFIPKEDEERVKAALYNAGAGQLGKYKNCSFSLDGKGTFMPADDADPHIGEPGKQEIVDEARVEVIFPAFLEKTIVSALRSSHPYEEVAYYLSTLSNDNQEVGAGMTGLLDTPMEPKAFLQSLKNSMNLNMIRHTRPIDRPVKKVAVCGGAGSFLLPKAIQAGADVFVSADFKYHEFFDADSKIMIVDIGHYESEIFTKDLLKEVLIKKFPTFAINFSKTATNPISYL
ncbi:MAG TPA: Nif3-like dinuclear metal center hexameric protein [Ohtaekwangia sp.]|nr:Nif3-like dinuclear metal center hexameric protein [Ohtaekwangia sp.]